MMVETLSFIRFFCYSPRSFGSDQTAWQTRTSAERTGRISKETNERPSFITLLERNVHNFIRRWMMVETLSFIRFFCYSPRSFGSDQTAWQTRTSAERTGRIAKETNERPSFITRIA